MHEGGGCAYVEFEGTVFAAGACGDEPVAVHKFRFPRPRIHRMRPAVDLVVITRVPNTQRKREKSRNVNGRRGKTNLEKNKGNPRMAMSGHVAQHTRTRECHTAGCLCRRPRRRCRCPVDQTGATFRKLNGFLSCRYEPLGRRRPQDRPQDRSQDRFPVPVPSCALQEWRTALS